jgi:hypothetical protein
MHPLKERSGMTKTVLLIGGSLNQTTMMRAIANHLPEHDCYFTPFYADGALGTSAEIGMLDFTILGGRHRDATMAYLEQEGLPVDVGGEQRQYDLVVTCTDLFVPRNIIGKRIVLVQEGMMEPTGFALELVRSLRFPRYLANTAATGLSDSYDVFCVASPGYRDWFIRNGVKAEKVIVTGIPNFDNVASYLENDFPHQGYVLAATSNARETFKWDDRPRFIQEAVRIADGRPLFFKLHPSERIERARSEIERYAPQARVFVDGNTNHMIANCEVLITQYSSATFIGLALRKEVYTYLDLQELRRLLPIQNGGASARNIAEICKGLMERAAASTPLDFRRTLKQRSRYLDAV